MGKMAIFWKQHSDLSAPVWEMHEPLGEDQAGGGGS